MTAMAGDSAGTSIAGELVRAGRGFLKSLREHSLFGIVIILYLVAGAALPAILGRPMAYALTGGEIARIIWMIGLWVLIIALVAEIVVAARIAPRGGILRHVWRRIATQYLRADRLWGGLITLMLFPPLVHNFAYMKSLLSILHPLDWDPTFAIWDRWLHFGTEPWELLQPILGHPLVSAGFSCVYAAWFFVVYGVMIWQAFSRRDSVLRMQFLLATVLIWIVLGNIVATLLASGGPVYYGRLTGLADPYAPLFVYLHEAAKVWPNYALGIQDMIWRTYLTNGRDGQFTASISAMPSLHVASSCSFYLLARATNRWLGVVFGLFTLLILIGSVHLGWHYAIDGYAGIVGAVALWWTCGRIVRWRPVHRMLWGFPEEEPKVAASRG